LEHGTHRDGGVDVVAVAQHRSIPRSRAGSVGVWLTGRPRSLSSSSWA
jgi:hypothetical protein